VSGCVEPVAHACRSHRRRACRRPAAVAAGISTSLIVLAGWLVGTGAVRGSAAGARRRRDARGGRRRRRTHGRRLGAVHGARAAGRVSAARAARALRRCAPPHRRAPQQACRARGCIRPACTIIGPPRRPARSDAPVPCHHYLLMRRARYSPATAPQYAYGPLLPAQTAPCPARWAPACPGGRCPRTTRRSSRARCWAPPAPPSRASTPRASAARRWTAGGRCTPPRRPSWAWAVSGS
jgi:hypothetical protein